MPRNTMKKFWSFVPLDDPDESICSLWKGPVSGGYGRFQNKLGMDNTVPRAIWEMEHGKIPKGMCVCHTCDNPLCIRLSHLFLGSFKDNMNDRIAKGHARGPRGEKNGATTLTEAHVLAIRMLANELIPPKIIAKCFKMRVEHVYAIINRNTWTHI